jgi:hypothetical protein
MPQYARTYIRTDIQTNKQTNNFTALLVHLLVGRQAGKQADEVDKCLEKVARLNRVHLEKITSPLVISFFPICVWMSKIHYRIHKGPALGPHMRQINHVHRLTTHLFKIQNNIIL